MATSTYKGYILIATGDEEDTWGIVLNAQALQYIDQNMGGWVEKSLTNVNVTLSADENRNLILRLTGTLSGAVQITSTLQGMMVVENLTSGAFAVTFTNGFGSPITLQQGTRNVVIADTTNGARVAANDASEFASGTRLLFQQTAAPTGWTKDVTNNDKALRVVSGSVVGGGSVAFSTAFASQGVTGTIGGTVLTVDQIPLHGHPFRTSGTSETLIGTGGMTLSTVGAANNGAYTGTPSNTVGQQIGGTGGGQSHNHTFSGTAINLAVQYVDVIIAQKD